MSQRLRGLGDVYQGGDVVFPGIFRGSLVDLDQLLVIPGMDRIKVVALVAFFCRAGFTLEPLQNGVNILFYHLKLVGNRDAIAVIVNGDDRWCMQNANGIDCLPEKTFRGRSVANGDPGHLIAVV
ncbi:hypothetical protein SDC9_83163 [bioreactor metagenome]|uniref:Uncharacterized protein n=1 Tax=bioreactor metagenome TaxID=1076179 RepID=A0A644ZFC2_9ZZZZ